MDAMVTTETLALKGLNHLIVQEKQGNDVGFVLINEHQEDNQEEEDSGGHLASLRLMTHLIRILSCPT